MMSSSILAYSLENYLPVVVLFVVAAGFGVVNLILPKVLGWLAGNRKNDGKAKQSTYESGMDPLHTARKRFNIRFYILAMTFLVFDVEVIFLLPWATAFPNLDAAGGWSQLFLIRVIFFVGTTVVAYLYAWRKGIFRYD